MPTKVYLSGDNIIVDKLSEPPLLTISIENAQYTFLGTVAHESEEVTQFENVNIGDLTKGSERSDLISEIQDAGGTPIGDHEAVKAYFDTFFTRGAGQIVEQSTTPIIDSEKLTIDTNFNPFVLASSGTEYLMYLLRVKSGSVEVDIKSVVSSILSGSNDDFLIRAGVDKTFDHAFVDGNFADIGGPSVLQLATPGQLGVPDPVEAIGFSASGRNTKAKYGRSGSEIESINGTPFRITEGVTYAITGQGGGAGASLNVALNWQEIEC